MCVEDVRHFLLECPAYQHIRLQYDDVFTSTYSPCESTHMLAVFDYVHQDRLAHAVYTMTKLREACLSAPQASDVQLEIVQQLVQDDIELIRIGH